MKRLFKLIVVLVMLGGWPLAFSAIHVVRTPGQLPVIGSMLPDWGTVHVFTKDQLGFKQTFADTRAWTIDDVIARPILVTRMVELSMTDTMASAGTADDIDGADPWIYARPTLGGHGPQQRLFDATGKGPRQGALSPRLPSVSSSPRRAACHQRP